MTISFWLNIQNPGRESDTQRTIVTTTNTGRTIHGFMVDLDITGDKLRFCVLDYKDSSKLAWELTFIIIAST